MTDAAPPAPSRSDEARDWRGSGAPVAAPAAAPLPSRADGETNWRSAGASAVAGADDDWRGKLKDADEASKPKRWDEVYVCHALLLLRLRRLSSRCADLCTGGKRLAAIRSF